MSKLLIKAEAERRGIPYLVHFTRIPNLRSILEYGLYPLGRHYELASRPAVNDEGRLDCRPDATSVSIAFPNSKLLFKFRSQDYPGTDWVILKLQPSILWEHDCLFCWKNAASKEIRGKSDEGLQSSEAFAGMFDELPQYRSRAKQRLHSFDPTHVQAEVLVRGVIEPSKIVQIVFQNPLDMSKWELTASTERTPPCLVSPMFFGERDNARSM